MNTPMKSILYSRLLLSLLMASGASTELLAQPPGLPTEPDQAPLGGLGLLAAAGGAYAWNKLRKKQDVE